MATFEYNPLCESVTVTYVCPHCGHTNKDTFSVPEPDLLAETHHDSINQDFSEAICEECEQEFNVVLTNGYYGGYGEIEEVDNVIAVEENIPGEDDDYFDKQLYDLTHTDIDKLLDASESLPEEVRPMLYKLLYANAITMMETYLGDTLKREVLKNEKNIRKFVETYKDYAKKQIKLSDLFSEKDALPKIIRQTLNTLLYHDLPKIKPIYHDALGVDLGEIGELCKAVVVRHHIVHRNGVDLEGNPCDIGKQSVQELQTKVQHLINRVNLELIDKNYSGIKIDEKGMVTEWPFGE